MQLKSLLGAAALLIAVTSGCDRALSPEFTDHFRVGIELRFSQLMAEGDVHRVRLTVMSNDAPLGAPQDFDVDPRDAEWPLSIAFDPQGADVVRILIELFDENGLVIWSALTEPIEVVAGQSKAATFAQLRAGPIENATATSVVLTPDTRTITEGDQVTLAAVVAGAPGGRAVWISLDPALATVNAGVVTGRMPGIARIVAAAGIRADTARITVTGRATNVVVNPDTTRILVGEFAHMAANATDARGGYVTGGFTWHSSNAAVATVDHDGNITATGAGTAVIRATLTGTTTSSTAVVFVAPAFPMLEGVYDFSGAVNERNETLSGDWRVFNQGGNSAYLTINVTVRVNGQQPYLTANGLPGGIIIQRSGDISGISNTPGGSFELNGRFVNGVITATWKAISPEIDNPTHTLTGNLTAQRR